MEVVASLSQGRTAATQCGFFTYKSVPVIFEPPCTYLEQKFNFPLQERHYYYIRKGINSICLPVIRPPRGVLTPDALLTADRENDPASGKERTNELMMLAMPNANNS